jgi:indole-3-glycerol phosphate synthase
VLDELIDRRRKQNLAAPRQDARGVAPSIRSFAQAIDRQRQGLERVPLLRGARQDLVQVARALDEAEVAALAISLDDPQAELARFAEAARAVSVPVLRVDLILEEFQVYESRVAGADAVFLHASAVPPELLARLAQAAKGTHMAACIACGSAEDLARAAALKPAVLALPEELLQAQVPPRMLVLALTQARAARGRADAVLDEQLGESPDPAQAFRAALAEED